MKLGRTHSCFHFVRAAKTGGAKNTKGGEESTAAALNSAISSGAGSISGGSISGGAGSISGDVDFLEGLDLGVLLGRGTNSKDQTKSKDQFGSRYTGFGPSGGGGGSFVDVGRGGGGGGGREEVLAQFTAVGQLLRSYGALDPVSLTNNLDRWIHR